MIDVSSVDVFIAQALASIARRDAADHRAILAELERGARLRVVIDPVGVEGPARIRLRMLRLEGKNRWLYGSVLAR